MHARVAVKWKYSTFNRFGEAFSPVCNRCVRRLQTAQMNWMNDEKYIAEHHSRIAEIYISRVREGVTNSSSWKQAVKGQGHDLEAFAAYVVWLQCILKQRGHAIYNIAGGVLLLKYNLVFTMEQLKNMMMPGRAGTQHRDAALAREHAAALVVGSDDTPDVDDSSVAWTTSRTLPASVRLRTLSFLAIGLSSSRM